MGKPCKYSIFALTPQLSLTSQGLRTKTADGIEYYGYGGDFGDYPNDGHFVMDGLLFSDHTPNPGLIEYRKAIEPVQVLSNKFRDNKVEIINRYDYITLDHLKCEWHIVGDGFTTEVKEVEIPKGKSTRYHLMAND
jgi:beta-galactosidase